jgi:hypothetical protein
MFTKCHSPLLVAIQDEVYLPRETADSDEFLRHITDSAAHIWNSPVGKQRVICSVVEKERIGAEPMLIIQTTIVGNLK